MNYVWERVRHFPFKRSFIFPFLFPYRKFISEGQVLPISPIRTLFSSSTSPSVSSPISSSIARTTADDLFPLFDKYGKVVNIFIPKDRRTSDSCGFAFVCYKYDDKAQKAVDRLDGTFLPLFYFSAFIWRVVDGREITVQFAKYGPNAERIQKERIIESFPRSRSRSPRRRFDFLEGTPILPLFTGTTIKKIGIIEEEVEVEVITDMNVIDIVGKTETLGAKAGAIVLVLFVLKAGEEIVMMKIGEVAVDQGGLYFAIHDVHPSPQKSPSPRKASSPRGESPDRRSRDGHSPSPRSVSPRGRRADSRSLSSGNTD
ncbi:Serine/arginine-rich splicing factor SC35 [Hibiscus syriacus]|uniref:Serine/arginine-rich splicing factor SC35 n=1 Tax=Hibiscus syriacus TaxID=106335 RepID=A0A6A3CNY7_HIBSY|nr:Serine/arginine-rich splicing factor SC35 [Hibiscus syriacus]